MALTLHVFLPSIRTFKVLLTAQMAGVEYHLQTVNLANGEQRSAEHTALNINQRTPVLVNGDYIG
jgi:glutathione S-transferase